MVRGSTPTFVFSLPFPSDYVTMAKITFAQGCTNVERDLTTCACDGNDIKLTLTQEETLRFKSGVKTDIQLAVKAGEFVFRSRIFKVDTEKTLNEEVLEE